MRFCSLFLQVPEASFPRHLLDAVLRQIPDWKLPALDATVQGLLESGIAPSTAAAYRAGLRWYNTFCHQAGPHPIPSNGIDNLSFCTAYLHNVRLSSCSIRLYLSALRYHQIVRGFGKPPVGAFSRLHYILRGIARRQPSSGRPSRLPITVDVLHLLFHAWDKKPPRYESTMLWAACTLGFFAFLRSGEFTVTQNRGVPLLKPGDVRVNSRSNPTYLTVTLRGSKTDTFGQGCTLYLGRSWSRVCPVVALLAYLAVRPSVPGPLFIHANGTPLTRSQLVASIRHPSLR